MQRCDACGAQDASEVEFQHRDFKWSYYLCEGCKERKTIFQLAPECKKRVVLIFPGCYARMRIWEIREFVQMLKGWQVKVMITMLVECNKTGVLNEPDHCEGEREVLSKTAVVEYCKEATENWSGQLPNGHPLRTLKVVAINGMEVK